MQTIRSNLLVARASVKSTGIVQLKVYQSAAKAFALLWPTVLTSGSAAATMMTAAKVLTSATPAGQVVTITSARFNVATLMGVVPWVMGHIVNRLGVTAPFVFRAATLMMTAASSILAVNVAATSVGNVA
jgi:hypothetical protein